MKFLFSTLKLIPFKAHLLLDSVAGISFIVLPFALGLGGLARYYLVLMGVGVLLVVGVTRTDD